MLYVCIGIVLAAGSGIVGLAVIYQKIQAVPNITVLSVSLAIEHVVLCNLVVFFLHQGNLHLVLDLLYTHPVADSYV